MYTPSQHVHIVASAVVNLRHRETRVICAHDVLRMIIGWIPFIILTEVICFNTVPCLANLVSNLNSRSHDPESPLKLITYCVDCPFPEYEGTVISGLVPRFGLKEYFVSAQLVYCIPNLADSKIINEDQLNGRIVVVDRGNIGLYEKALRISKSGAVGMIIADDGQCNDIFTFCGPRAGSVKDGGFAAHDYSSELWRGIKIPVLLVTSKTAETIRRLMPVERILLPNMGYHNITILMKSDGSRDDL